MRPQDPASAPPTSGARITVYRGDVCNAADLSTLLGRLRTFTQALKVNPAGVQVVIEATRIVGENILRHAGTGSVMANLLQDDAMRWLDVTLIADTDETTPSTPPVTASAWADADLLVAERADRPSVDVRRLVDTVDVQYQVNFGTLVRLTKQL